MKKSLLFLLLILPYFAFGQNSYYNNAIVSATIGLRGRKAPTINSNIIKVYPYGHTFYLMRRSENKETINGINDYWYSTWDYSVHKTVWVFGGFLTDRIESHPFVGFWRNEGTINSRLDIPWIFELNGKFSNIPPESDAGVFGSYELINNNLTLIYIHPESRRENARVEFINENRIRLIFNDRVMILNRWNNIW